MNDPERGARPTPTDEGPEWPERLRSGIDRGIATTEQRHDRLESGHASNLSTELDRP
jgi:hypothetical protein